MNVVERMADRLPIRLIRPVSVAAVASGLTGAACLFGATAFGSIVWAGGGVAAFSLAAVLWHIAAIAGESLSPRRAGGADA